MLATLPAADPTHSEADRVAAAGFDGDVARWYDVALEPLEATSGELRRGLLLFDSSDLSEQELQAAFVGAPLVVDKQAVGVIVRATLPQRRGSYASIEAVTAAYVRDTVERFRTTAPSEAPSKRLLVYISYAPDDGNAAERVRRRLEAAGIDVWFDRSQLTLSTLWEREIEQATDRSALFIPIVSRRAIAGQDASGSGNGD